MTHNVFTDDDSTLPDGTYEVMHNGSILATLMEDDGYFVSITNNKTFPAKDILKIGLESLWLSEVFIGVWTSPDQERFIDLTIHVGSRSKAETLARLFNQQAIWDIEAGAAIFLEQSN